MAAGRLTWSLRGGEAASIMLTPFASNSQLEPLDMMFRHYRVRIAMEKPSDFEFLSVEIEDKVKSELGFMVLN